jgi:long-chain fatty acid transport protein
MKNVQAFHRPSFRPTRVAAALLLATCASPTWASGMYLYATTSASEPGYGGAGMVARANDAGTVFSNPAGMTRFDVPELMAGPVFVYIHGPQDINREESTAEGNSRTVKVFIPAGASAYVYPVSDRLKLGVNLSNNFGLALNWNSDWVGRYDVTQVALMAPQLQPTAAYKVNDWLSVGAGAGLTMGYLKDKGRVETLPGRGDGKLRISDADFAVQYNLGIMLEPWEHTRIGLRYLTETDLNFKDAPDISGTLLNPNYERLDLGMKMPQSLFAGIHHQVNDDWAVLGSVGWDEMSEFGRVRVTVKDGFIPVKRVDGDFRDTWHFGVGTEYQVNPRWMLTGGFSYDTSMATDRTATMDIPLATLYRYAAGVKYKAREDLTLGAGLTWLYEGNLPYQETAGVVGKYKNVSITFLSFYARWH